MATLLSTQTQKTRHYQTDQQVKYLHLEAEIDILLQKLTAYKEQKQVLEEFSAKSTESIK
jgi:hypothetical protein